MIHRDVCPWETETERENLNCLNLARPVPAIGETMDDPGEILDSPSGGRGRLRGFQRKNLWKTFWKAGDFPLKSEGNPSATVQFLKKSTFFSNFAMREADIHQGRTHGWRRPSCTREYTGRERREGGEQQRTTISGAFHRKQDGRKYEADRQDDQG